LKISQPTPALAAIISADTTVMNEFPIASFIPVTMCGTAAGIVTVLNTWSSLAPSDRAASSLSSSSVDDADQCNEIPVRIGNQVSMRLRSSGCQGIAQAFEGRTPLSRARGHECPELGSI